MKSSAIFKNICKDKYYLLKLYSVETLLFSIAILILLKFRSFEALNFSAVDFLLLIPAVIMGWLVSSFLHNTSHDNIKNRFLNLFVGEFCGAWVMYGFRNFILIHILHHKYTDEEFDPVNPSGMTFLVFVTAPMRYMIKRAKSFLEDNYKSEENYHKIMIGHDILFHLNLVLRLAFWFTLFGPKLFLLFYIPSVISNIAILAHINYVCHQDHEDGSVEIFNLNHNLYYKVANFITIGGYYHKSHHLNQNLFDPRALKTKRSKERLISKQAQGISLHQDYQYSGSLISKYFEINGIWGERKKNFEKAQSKDRLAVVHRLSL
ncbi:fatty acid desaturase [Bacteriovorax sp. Seq25_V]|uniref:fatty acid desaturase n=1 Tax=Bacteriovorax sp. Seq25_V TaxID=1201288 RepID=UPI000389E903|nr:fatty acid desaturase [Bacteriovorax sp. Seq25_V]EQC43732.1 stearoyl-CoA 9-desaturase [Bacteriovorax sp. Seq25_V]